MPAVTIEEPRTVEEKIMRMASTLSQSMSYRLSCPAMPIPLLKEYPYIR